MARMEEKHKDERDGFRTDRDEEARKLQAQEHGYFEALKAVNAYLEEAGAGPDLIGSGEDYVRTLDNQLMQKSRDLLENLREIVKGNLREANALIKQKKDQLTAYLMAFTRMQKAMFSHLQAEYGWELRQGYESRLSGLLDRLNAVARTAPKDVPTVHENLSKRQSLTREELARLEGELNRGMEKNQQTMVTIRESHRALSAALSRPLETTSGESAPNEVLTAIGERLDAAERELQEIVEAAGSSHDTVERLRGQYRKKSEATLAVYAGKNELALIDQLQGSSRLQRMMGARITEPLIPVSGLERADDPEPLARERENLTAEWQATRERLLDFEQRHLKLAGVMETLDSYNNFQQVYGSFRRAVQRKLMAQRAMGAITGRISQLDREAENLDEFIRENMLPAQADFARRVHLPEARKRLDYLGRTKAFVLEVQEIKFEALQREFLDRGIFRRFYAAQFRKGAHFGLNPDLPVFAKLGNLMQGMFLFHRTLQQTMSRVGNWHAGEISFTKLPTERPPGIMQFIEEQKELRPDHRFSYLFLPGTLPLSQALEIIQHKDEVFQGMPQLILIYISKFDTSLLLDDEELRDRYFNAVKHNVIVNIDEEQVIDNPKAIADRLLQDTLGCAHDFKVTEAGGEVGPTTQSGTA
jgi:hypothetical protein